MTDRIELYKLVVQTITANEQRRQQVNAAYSTMLIASLAAIGGIERLDPLYVVLPALPLALLWLANLRSFLRLAEAKFAVVAELEKGFDIQPFGMEWELVKASSNGLSPGLARLEMTLPAVVALTCIGYLVARGLGLSQ